MEGKISFYQYIGSNTLALSWSTVDMSELIALLRGNVHIIELSLLNATSGQKGAETLAKDNLSSLIKLYNSMIK